MKGPGRLYLRSCGGCAGTCSHWRRMQAEKMRLMKEAYTEAVGRLTELRSALVALSEELYEEKELSGARVKRILQDASSSDAPPP